MKKFVNIAVLLALVLTLLPAAALAQGEVITCENDVVVQADDWLSKIADKFYGDSLAFQAIAEATNAKSASDPSYAPIANVNVIEVGWKLCVPATDAAQTILERPEEVLKSTAALAGVDVTAFTMTGPFISGPIKVHAPSFKADTGGNVAVVEAPFADIFPKIQQVAATGSGDFDVVLVSNSWVSDLVNLGYVVPLDPFIERDQNDPMLAWNDIPEGIKSKMSWGGKTWNLIVDNDNQTMFYRKDILSDAKWQADYKAATGKDLPNPPQTLVELKEVAQFFHGKDWDGDGEAENGYITSVTRGAQSFWYLYPWVAPYTVVPVEKAPAHGILFFRPDNMKPLVNTPGFLRGVEEYKAMVDCCIRAGRDSVRADVIEEIVLGQSLMALDWGDTGPASVAERSVVKGDVGFSLTPGATEYWDWQTGAWAQMPAGQVNKAPTHAFNGWSYYITAASKNPDAAWEWIKYASNPQISALDVASPDSGYQPWRNSHATNLAPWIAAGWDELDARTYIQTILDATNHPNAVFEPRVPGATRYQETLEFHLLRALANEVSVQQAMDDLAAEWEGITEELGRDAQVKAYQSHLGM